MTVESTLLLGSRLGWLLVKCRGPLPVSIARSNEHASAAAREVGASVARSVQDRHGLSDRSITLRDGSVIEDALIVGGTITEIRGYDTIPFSVGDISDITVTHRKWAFRR